MSIIGIRNVDFTAKDGNRIIGVKLFCTFSAEFVEGVCAESVFVSNNVLSRSNITSLHVGDEIEVLYNKFGKVSGIVLI